MTRARKVVYVSLLIAAGSDAVLYWRLHRERSHRYTCAEMLGPHPQPNHIAILPGGYSAVAAFSADGREVSDYRIWDEHHRLVCDEQGRDVRR